MRINVYHVTSSIFIKSIKENGLMGIDLRRRLPELCPAMNEMIETLDAKYSDHGYDWGEAAGFHDNCRRMADLSFENSSGMDFEYGNLYATTAFDRIERYYGYKYGSELLTYFYKLYHCLYQKHNDGSKAAFDAKYSKLVRILQIENKQNLILKFEIDIADLLTDTGHPIDDAMKKLMLSDYFKGFYPASYRVTRHIMPDEIEVLTLAEDDFISHGKLSEFVVPEEWEQISLDDGVCESFSVNEIS